MSKWFERHHQFLVRETTQLQSSSRYKEKYQRRNNLFVSTGEFIVRVNGKSEPYPATFVYLEATPYALPKVYLTQTSLDEQEIEKLANLSSGEVQQYMTPSAKFYLRRHQNSDGSLCLLEEDNLDREGVQAFDANEVISRVHKWLTGLTTNVFPQDNNEAELVAHYPLRDNIYFLITEDFLRSGLSHGEFYFQSVTREHFPTYCLGACLIGASVAGLFLEDPNEVLPLMPEGLQTRAKIAANTSLLEKSLEEKSLFEGHWWQLNTEPGIYANAFELAKALGNGDQAKGEDLLGVLWPQLRQRAERIHIGVRYLNRRGEQEWLMLLCRKARSENPANVDIRTPNTMEALKDYDLVAIHSELFTDRSYFLRNQGRAERDVLKSQTISVIGCGAIGGEIADILGKAGVGQMWLNDNQFMHVHNSVRHIAGTDLLGLPKVVAVARIIQDHNRFLFPQCRMSDIMMYPVDDYIAPEGIVVSSIANDNTELCLNEQLVERKRTSFYVRALRGGKAARVFKVKPGKDACFYCLTLHRNDKHPDFIDIPEDYTLPTIKNECNNPVRPSSAADLKMIAAMSARWIVEACEGSETEANHWVWVSEPELNLGATTEFPQVVIAKFLPIHPDCPLCRSKSKEVRIKKDAVEFMQDMTRRTPGIETGGVLIGRIDEAGTISIEKASGPGPKANCTATEFVRDTEYCQNFIDENARSGLRYVGEWHSHPNDNNNPSETDIKSLTEIAQDKNYLTTTPAMIIFKRSGDPSCTIHPHNDEFYSVPLQTV
jgi:integrative and conjugative element protein (TIGR02256 family)